MKGLLGFAVLTGPLWLIVLLLIFGIWLAFKIAKRFTSAPTKVAAGIGIVAVVLILPFADEIAGRVYLNYLCATEAGVKVYHTVELPAEYWDAEGRARFIIREGYLDFDESMLGNQFFRKSSSQLRSTFFGIDRDSYQLVDRAAQSVLGEDINFRHRGGWISRNLSPHVSAISCDRDQVGYFTDVLKNVFKPASSTSKEMGTDLFSERAPSSLIRSQRIH